MALGGRRCVWARIGLSTGLEKEEQGTRRKGTYPLRRVDIEEETGYADCLLLLTLVSAYPARCPIPLPL